MIGLDLDKTREFERALDEIFHWHEYDSYIPAKNKIESMSIAISGLDENIQYFQQGEYNELNYRNNYMDPISYQLKYMKLTDFDTAYNLAEIGVKQPSENIDNNRNDIYYTYSVKYSLNSGRDVYRTYRFPIGKNRELLNDIYKSAEF